MGGLSLCSLLSLQSTCWHDNFVTEPRWHENIQACPPIMGSWNGLVIGELHGEVGENLGRTPFPLPRKACSSCSQRRGQAVLEMGIGQTNVGVSYLPYRRHGVMRKGGVQPCTGWVGGAGKLGAASFTFTLSSGAHGKALLALAVVGAGCVDASLSSADRRLLTFISVCQHTGRQS